MPLKRSQLQFLWDLAQATLGQGDAPTHQQLEALKQALVNVPLSELGLSPTSPSSPIAQPEITYLHIQENEFVSLGIFCLPASAQIPLHNHPGMTVLSRVLYGQMHIQSFDLLDNTTENESNAASVHDRVFTADDRPIALFPSSGGNIHQFTALTDCAVLDLLSPPYSTDDGRDCTYYKLVEKDDGTIMLEEYEPPTEFVIHSRPYIGTAVHVRSSTSNAGSTTTAISSSPASNGSGSPRSVTPPRQSTPLAEEDKLTALLREASLDGKSATIVGE